MGSSHSTNICPAHSPTRIKDDVKCRSCRFPVPLASLPALTSNDSPHPKIKGGRTPLPQPTYRWFTLSSVKGRLLRSNRRQIANHRRTQNVQISAKYY